MLFALVHSQMTKEWRLIDELKPSIYSVKLHDGKILPSMTVA